MPRVELSIPFANTPSETKEKKFLPEEAIQAYFLTFMHNLVMTTWEVIKEFRAEKIEEGRVQARIAEIRETKAPILTHRTLLENRLP